MPLVLDFSFRAAVLQALAGAGGSDGLDLLFKGEGFYLTDYARKGGSSGGGSSTGGSGSKDSGSASSTSGSSD